MNNISLTKIATSAIATATLFSSCLPPVNQQQRTNRQPQAMQNPYAVPGLNGHRPTAPIVENPSYQQNQQTAPYQPLPGIPSAPRVSPAPPVTPSVPSTNKVPAQPSATSHDVLAGESLWRISRKYGVTVDALKEANGLKNNNIWAGQKLTIPAAN